MMAYPAYHGLGDWEPIKVILENREEFDEKMARRKLEDVVRVVLLSSRRPNSTDPSCNTHRPYLTPSPVVEVLLK